MSRSRIALFLPLAAGLLGVSALGRADDVLDGLRANQAALREAEGTVEFRTIGLKDDSHQNVSITRWAIRGHDDLVTSLKTDGTPRNSSLNRDGQHYSYEPAERVSAAGSKAVYHVSHLRSPDVPNDALMFGVRPRGEWYADLAARGELKVVDRSQPDLVEVVGRFPRTGQFRAWLKPSAGYLAVRAEFEIPEAGARSEIEVTRWVRQNGAVLPLAGVYTDHEPYGGGLTIRTEMRALASKVGEVPLARMQLPTLVPGSIVKDDVEGRTWEIGPSGERINRGAIGHVEPKSPLLTLHGWFMVAVIGSVLTGGGISARRTFAVRRSGGSDRPTS